jgi:hypothetical protein
VTDFQYFASVLYNGKTIQANVLIGWDSNNILKCIIPRWFMDDLVASKQITSNMKNSFRKTATAIGLEQWKGENPGWEATAPNTN